VIAASVLAEWTKARTVRSTWWSLVTTAALCVGPGVLVGLQFGNATPEQRGDISTAQVAFYPILIGQIALVVLGVLLAGAEYTTGTIRASLSAVPRRGVFLTAKALVAAGLAAVTGVVTAFATFLATQRAMGPVGVPLGSPGVQAAVWGAAGYLTLICVFAVGLATVLRSSAMTLGILVPLLFLNSQGLSSLPAIRSVTQYLPDQAGAVLMQVSPDSSLFVGKSDLDPAGALFVLLAWVGAALVGGYLSLRRRDA
jgi:ABC-type transport system involved in multi-copper enzyme maturation permease subunit